MVDRRTHPHRDARTHLKNGGKIFFPFFEVKEKKLKERKQLTLIRMSKEKQEYKMKWP